MRSRTVVATVVILLILAVLVVGWPWIQRNIISPYTANNVTGGYRYGALIKGSMRSSNALQLNVGNGDVELCTTNPGIKAYIDHMVEEGDKQLKQPYVKVTYSEAKYGDGEWSNCLQTSGETVVKIDTIVQLGWYGLIEPLAPGT